MAKYKVIKHFQWGDLILDKDQVILVTSQDDECSLVSAEDYPDKTQIVSTKAVESMVFLKKIEKY